MKQKNHPLFLLMIFCWTWNSCSTPRVPLNNRYIYSPANVASPTMKAKGDLVVSPSIFIKESKGFGIQAAYAPVNYFYAQFSYYSVKDKDAYSDNDITLTKVPSEIHYKRRNAGVGIGFFYPLVKRKLFVNFLSGVDFGKLNSDLLTPNSASAYYFNANSNHYYFTPALHIIPKPYFRINVGAKISMTRFNDFETNYRPENLKHTQLAALYNNNFVFIDPYINLQLGFNALKFMKLNCGISGSIFTNSESYTNLKNRPVMVQLGLSIEPGPLVIGKKSK